MDHESLAKILKYLAKKDLMEVVEEDIWLLPIARRVFEQKFHAYFGDYASVTNEYETKRDEISASLDELKYRRVFGNVIRKHVILYKVEYRSVDHIIDQAIVEHCHKSLEKLKIRNASRFSMLNINETFEKVTQRALRWMAETFVLSLQTLQNISRNWFRFSSKTWRLKIH